MVKNHYLQRSKKQTLKGKLNGNILALILLWIATFVELQMLTLWRTWPNVYVSVIIWMVAGLLVGMCGIKLGVFKNAVSTKSDRPISHLILLAIVFIGGSWINASVLGETIARVPATAMESDVVPSMVYYVQRMLAGEVVYNPMPFPGWTVDPTYMPFMWLPYTFSELAQIDYRWTPLVYFLVVLPFYFYRIYKVESNLFFVVLKAVVPFFFVHQLLITNDNFFGKAVELTIVAHYLILCLTVFHRSKMVIALGIIICLLSRYAFSFWLPVYLLIYWAEYGFKGAFKIGLYIVVGIVLFYILPFLSQRWESFGKGMAYYADTVNTMWFPKPWQAATDKPHYLVNGMTFSIYFYDFIDGDVLGRLGVNKWVHLIVSIMTAVGIFLYYWFNRMKGLNVKLYLIFALKIYLIVFFSLMYVSFTYLYMLPLFMSIPILYNINMGQYLNFKND